MPERTPTGTAGPVSAGPELYEIDRLDRGGPYFDGAGQRNPLDSAAEGLLAADLPRFQNCLETALLPQRPYLTETELGIYRRGKKIRPLLLMLAARLITGAAGPGPDPAAVPLSDPAAGPLSDKVIKASVSLEMLHVASLIHDDIIDDALLRRGLQSVNASRGTNTAILVGDLQFLQAIRTFLGAIETEREMGLVSTVLDSAFDICTGELDEIATDPGWDIPRLEQRYYDVIERKTAVMFGLACETGVALAGGRSADARRLGFYGRRIGRSFQIMDDILDFLQDGSKAGKRPGIDLKMRRLTLPILYAMQDLGPDHPLTRYVRRETDALGDLDAAIDVIKGTDALQRSYGRARQEALDALTYLVPFERNAAFDHLEALATYIVDRRF
ncbi:polyprenyl synthetase family protein [Novispirillum itersonii]|uniref:Heptaprenyl diphosphate synthase n=1 Tax=Novispirillum itersonii TaxID=189 RepID=A0A7W9ZJ46_NOVIT|nr:polyprenyl synthetase family protein [Novispirillum itersonii]MBB6211104.1 heptaprenyl diphosphate synthase [Novispirillum itersonii]